MAQVLLLNATSEPLAIITRNRALSLLRRGRVEPACTDEVELKAVSEIIHIPAVIRLRYFVNVPQRGLRWQRRLVLERDSYTCIYCGLQPGGRQRGRILTKQDFTVDHILPISRGGRNSWSNTACACPRCNQHKGNRTPHEANMKLRWEPKTPRVNYLIASGDIPAAWKVYLELPG